MKKYLPSILLALIIAPILAFSQAAKHSPPPPSFRSNNINVQDRPIQKSSILKAKQSIPAPFKASVSSKNAKQNAAFNANKQLPYWGKSRNTNETSSKVDTFTNECFASYSTEVNHELLMANFFNHSMAPASTSYFWDFGDYDSGDNNYSEQNSPNHKYTKSGYYFVCLYLYDSVSQCYNDYCTNLAIGKDTSQSCYAYFNYEQQENTVNFYNRSSGGDSYSWNFGDGNGYSALENPVYTYSKDGYYHVTLTIFNSTNNCQETYSEVIQIGTAGCLANFIIKDGADSTTFSFVDNSISQDSSLQWYWDFGDGGYSNEQNPTYSYRQSGYYTVCFYIYSDNGCYNSKCQDLVVGDVSNGCHANFSYYTDETNNTAYFYDYSYGNISKWSWDFGDGIGYSNDQNPLYQYKESGYYTVSLSTYDSLTGCHSSYSETIRFGNEGGCASDFTFFVDTANNTTKFTSTSLGNPTSFYWDFGDYNNYESNYSYDENPSHTYLNNGYYSVCLYINNDSTGCYDSKCMTVAIGDVSNDCKANYSFYTDNESKTTQFYDYSYGSITSWYWDFGDGNHSFDPYPVHTYEKAGIYKVCLTVSDTSNKCHNQYCSQVQINDGESMYCYADFTYIPDSTGNIVKFSDASVHASQWYWYFGDGEYSNEQNPIHTYAEEGYYYVSLYISDSTGQCGNQMSYYVAVGTGGCKSSFTYYPDYNGNGVYFSNSSYGDISDYYWDFGDGTYSSEAYPYHEYKEEGVYEVCLSIKNADGSCEDRTCDKISFGDNQCNPEFTYFINVETDSVTFYSSNPSDDLYYYWDFGNGEYSNEANPTTHYSRSDIYYACLSIYNKMNYCGNQNCQEIQIGDGGGCRSDFEYFINQSTKSVSFKNNSHTSNGDTLSYYWSFGDGYTSEEENPDHTYTDPGFYYAYLSVYNSETGCFSDHYEEINIGDIGCYADFGYSVNPDSTSVSLYNYSKGGDKYYWDFGDGEVSKNESPTHAYVEPGYYTICLTVYNGTENCADSRCYEIQIGSAPSNCKADFSSYVDAKSRIVRFENTSVGSFSDTYWDFGDGSTSSKAKPAHRYKSDGYYYVCLGIYNNNTGCYDYKCDNILVGKEGVDCAAQFDYYTDPSTKDVKFYDKSVGGASAFFWDFGDGTSGDGEKVSHTYAEEGIYFVCEYVVNEDNGCYNTTCNYVQVGDGGGDCEAIFTSSVDSVSRKATFSDLSKGNPNSWTWDFGDSTATSNVQNPTHVYAANGYYIVNLTIKTADGCENFYVDIVNVNGGDSLKAAFDEDEKDSVGVNGVNGITFVYPVEFHGEALGDVSKFLWEFGDGNTFDKSKQVTHNYLEPGLYTVCLTVSDPVINKQAKYCKQLQVGAANPDGIKSNKKDLLNLNCYPNPFSRTTNIVYQLTQSSNVKIIVTDMLGNTVQTLMNENATPGKHQITWDANSVADGIYTVQVVTNNLVASKRVTLIR